MFYFILFSLCLFQLFNFKIQFPHFSISFSYLLNFKLTISQFQNSKCHKFENSNIPISNFKFLNLKSQIYKIPSFQFQNLNSKFLSFKFISEFLISNISNSLFLFQVFNFKIQFPHFSISFFYVFNFKLTISQFQNSKCHKFQNSNIQFLISNF